MIGIWNKKFMQDNVKLKLKTDKWKVYSPNKII